MQLLRVGHATNTQHGTGASVFIFDWPCPVAYHLCGSAPATREIHTLEFETAIPAVDGIALLGGSALGLGAVDGMVRWMQEHHRGFPTAHGAIPLIPAAAIYDLSEKTALPPTADEVYQACLNAKENNPARGQIGAGTGATVGKLIGNAQRMPGGIGHAEICLPNGVSVLAYAVVNSVGDIRNARGDIIAGARTDTGEWADCEQFLLSGQTESLELSTNTTLVAVFTNALFSKIELKRIAKMAVAGMGRAIAPIFTCYDGDIIFCCSLGEYKISEMVIGTMAAEAVRQAIVNAVL